MASMLTTDEIVKNMNLLPHPEGGFFVETFRDKDVILDKESLPSTFAVGRPISTAIYFLLPTGTVSNLHRMPSSEIWHFYAGEPLTVVEIHPGGEVKRTVLGNNILAGQKLQYVVPPNVWFGSFPTLDVEEGEDGKVRRKLESRDRQKCYSLVGCTVAPAFEFVDFVLATRKGLLDEFPEASDVIEILTPP